LPELICQTRAGESSSWFGIAPNETNALATALAIRPPIGMIAPYQRGDMEDAGQIVEARAAMMRLDAEAEKLAVAGLGVPFF
jgi:hypothetical protein